MRAIINSQDSLSTFVGQIRELWKEKKYLTVTVRHGKKRTLPQNSISHDWYLQVSREEKEYTPEQIKRLCKYHFGIPILRGDGLQVPYGGEQVDYGELVDRIIMPLPYEARIEAMEFLPVTSLMSTKQLTEYLETMQKHYAARVDLRFPQGEE